jgi:hypothetical protein
MRVLHVLLHYFRSLFFHGRREADLREERQGHLDREIEQLRATGLSHAAARQQALIAFGGVEQLKEACRDANGATVLDTLSRDVRYGLRRLARDWCFTAAAIVILVSASAITPASA